MKRSTIYTLLMLLTIHLLSVNVFAFDNDFHDPFSCSSCQDGLNPEQLGKTSIILEQARPKMQELRQLLQEKRQELRNLHYNVDTDPEVMIQLGIELQKQRKAIMNELQLINQRLQNEVGGNVRFKMPHGRGCKALQKMSNCPIYVHHAE